MRFLRSVFSSLAMWTVLFVATAPARAGAPAPASQPDAPPKFVRIQESLINLQHVNQINFLSPVDADGYYTITIFYLGDASPHVMPIKEAAEAKRAWQALLAATVDR